MEPSYRRVLPLMGIGILSATLGTGCATSSDLQKLNQGLNQSLQVQSRTMRVEIGALRDELKALRAETEGLRAQVGTFQQDTNAVLERMSEEAAIRDQTLRNLSTMTMNVKKEIETYGTTTGERLTKMEQMTGESAKEVRNIEKHVSDFNDRLDQLPPVVSALGSQVQSLTNTLWGSYEVEEAGLRDRLRALEAMRKRLRPLEARQQQPPPDVEK